ncbi:MAG: GDP-mannose 4,6-dehydratase [Planctomycetes bacterium]|nr:GDP-mannose 4,6-dehydratase [Planctomycetota bacterium]
MRILITGATGFVGGHLIERLLSDGGSELHGLTRHATWPAEWRHLAGSVALHAVDLGQQDQIEHLLRELRPEQIYHLAGYANTGKSFHEPALAWEGNALATFHLYDAIARSGIRPRVLFTSSGLVYGNPVDVGPDHLFHESDELRPSSPYASSKAAADLLSHQVTCHPGLDVVRVRCFNQIGPRQSSEYACPNFARQIALIEAGRQAPRLETGDLRGQRDLTDVRDMVRAFAMLMDAGKTGEVYNAGSGIANSMRVVLDRLLALARVKIVVSERIDPARRGDTTVSRADIRKLRSTTGWEPENSLDKSLADILEYWRQQAVAIRINGAA